MYASKWELNEGSSADPEGLHVAIIMDGNGRWARKRGLPRLEGHRTGAGAVRRTVRAAPAQGIGTLTLYAFSSDNWRRPPAEVAHLMRLLRTHLRKEAERCEQEGVRVEVIGRRDRLAGDVVRAIETVESRTRGGARLRLRLAIDYSARDAILEAVRLHAAGAVSARVACGPRQAATPPDRAAAASARAAPPPGRAAPPPPPSREEFGRLLGRAMHARDPLTDVDLLVRTAGEQRLSDFLLWECAYAEFVFTDCLWPDFDEAALESAVQEFHRRERRFGGLGAAPVQEVSHG